MQALADLRFVRRIDTLSTKRQAYAGRKFAAFTLDLSTWTSTRSEQIRPILFWEPEGRGKIHDPKLIYTPESSQPAAVSSGSSTHAESQLAEGEQLTFDDVDDSE